MIPRKNIARALKKAIQQPGYALSNLNHRLKSAFSYHFLNGRSLGPETVSLFLTYKCNLKCAMCGQWGTNGAFREFAGDVVRQALSLTEIQDLIDDIRQYKPNITLFGGEPMLYPDWLKTVEIIKKAGLRCNIVTNGTHIGQWVKEIVDVGLDEIIFSLDGPEAVHDKIRGVPGTYQKAISGLKALNDLKKACHTDKPIININCTLTDLNYHLTDEIICIAEDIGTCGLTFHHLLFLDRQTVTEFIPFFREKFGQAPTDWLGFIVDEKPVIDPEILIAKRNELRTRKFRTDVAFYPNLDDEEIRQWYTQFQFKSSSYKNRCQSLWATAYVFPDGAVRPYHTMNFSPGNVLETKFSQIWNNPTYTAYRRHIIKHKCFSVCAKGCTEFFRY
ncbi:MAG: radical SAM protein [Candidatus Neomarinimicrobiota bacterium]